MAMSSSKKRVVDALRRGYSKIVDVVQEPRYMTMEAHSTGALQLLTVVGGIVAVAYTFNGVILAPQFSDIEKKFQAIDKIFEATGKKFESIDRNMKSLDMKMDSLERSVKSSIAILDNKVDNVAHLLEANRRWWW